MRADRVRIETLGQRLRERGPVLRGRQSVWRMLDYLEGIEPGETVSLAEGVKNFCLRNPGKGIVVLITDLMDKSGYEAALRYLVSQQMDVYVIHVLQPGRARARRERRPQAGRLRRPRRRRDHRQCAAAGTLQGDAQRLHRRCQEFCTRRGMNYLLGQQPDAGEGSDLQLSATPGPGAMTELFSATRSHPWQWALLALVPPAIIALYFLKLRRQPLEVPSTYLWQRSIEDLHVNSLWQRLRQNLLMFLQLLLVALAMLALLRPGWEGSRARRPSVHLPGRQLGQHGGDRRRGAADRARRGEASWQPS